MADFKQLNQDIISTIFENDKNAITGQTLQSIMLEISATAEEAINKKEPAKGGIKYEMLEAKITDKFTQAVRDVDTSGGATFTIGDNPSIVDVILPGEGRVILLGGDNTPTPRCTMFVRGDTKKTGVAFESYQPIYATESGTLSLDENESAVVTLQYTGTTYIVTWQKVFYRKSKGDK